MWPFGFLNTELVEEVWNHQSWNAQQNNPYLLKTSMVISNPGIISINQAVNLTLTSRPSGPNSSWLCHATRQWRGNKGRSCGRGCGPEKKKNDLLEGYSTLKEWRQFALLSVHILLIPHRPGTPKRMVYFMETPSINGWAGGTPMT